MSAQINLYAEKDELVNTPYLSIIGMLYRLTKQQLRVLTEMAAYNNANPSVDRKQVAKNAGIKSIEAYNNIFSTLRKKGIIVAGKETKYAYASGILLNSDVKTLTINFIEYTEDAESKETDNS